MNKRLCAAAAAAAVATLPLLAACGSGSTPAAGSTTSAAAPATSAPASPTVAATPVSAPTSASAPTSTPAATPTSDPAKDTAEIRDVTEEFVHAGLTIGYPDKSLDTYLSRLKPLMTTRGYAEVRKSAAQQKNLDKGFTTLAKQHARTTPTFTSKVKVSGQTGTTARASLGYKMLTQVKTGGKWKTLQTSAKETASVQVVREGGHWLVEKTA